MNLIEAAAHQFLGHPFEFEVVQNLVPSPGFYIKLTADVASCKTFFIKIILLHKIKQNLFLSLRNQKKVAHLLLYLLMAPVLINAVAYHLLFDLRKCIGVMLHAGKG